MKKYTILEGAQLADTLQRFEWMQRALKSLEIDLEGIKGYRAVAVIFDDYREVRILQEATGWLFYIRRESSKYNSLAICREPNQFVDYRDTQKFEKWLQDGGMTKLPKPKNFSQLNQKAIDQWAEYLEQDAMFAQLFNVWNQSEIAAKKHRAAERLAAAGFKNSSRFENIWTKELHGLRCEATICSDGEVSRHFEVSYLYCSDLPEFCPEVND